MPNTPIPYPAKLSSSEFPEELIEGVIYCERWAFKFESERVQLSLTWGDLQIHTGGSEEDQVFFFHPERAELSLFTETAEILDDPVFGQITHLRNQLKPAHERRVARQYCKGVIKFLAGFALVAGLLYGVGGCAVKLAVNSVSAEWEKQLGTEILEEFEQTYDVNKTSGEARRLTELARRLARGQPGIKHPLEVYIINEKAPNALALPGGYILFTEGLLQLADEQERAGVLAHEIAHIRHRHGIERMIKSGGPYYALRILLGESGFAGLVTEGSHLLLHQSFSRAQEAEADALAWKYLVDANLDPRGLISFLEKVMVLEGAGSRSFAIAQTHPPTEQRIQALRTRWEQLPSHDLFNALSGPERPRPR